MKSTGVYENSPKNHSAFYFKTSLYLGKIDPEKFFEGKPKKYATIDFDRDIMPILETLMDKYRAYRYNMLLCNCNHFTDEFIQLLFNRR